MRLRFGGGSRDGKTDRGESHTAETARKLDVDTNDP